MNASIQATTSLTITVYGMPKEAVKLGAVERAVPLDAVAGAITQYANRV